MRLFLTKIERLDSQFPGLEADVMKWLTQGISAAKIAPLILEKYNVSVAKTTLGNFRTRRWVAEQRRLQERRIEVRARLEVAQEMEMRASLCEPLPGAMK